MYALYAPIQATYVSIKWGIRHSAHAKAPAL